ncbi:MAG: PH domain-containing protein [Candidatus Odinarchaeia archaeon]
MENKSLTIFPHPNLRKLYYLYLVIALCSLVLPGAGFIYVMGVFQVFTPNDVLVSFLLYIVPIILCCIIAAVWIPLYYRSLRYQLDDEYLIVDKGVWWKKHSLIPYWKITNIDIVQGPFSRRFKIAKLIVQTAGYHYGAKEMGEGVLVGVADPKDLRDEILYRASQYSKNKFAEQVARRSEPSEEILKKLSEISETLKKIERKLPK